MNYKPIKKEAFYKRSFVLFQRFFGPEKFPRVSRNIHANRSFGLNEPKQHFNIIMVFLPIQDLQRRLDLERVERNKTDSATLKLLSELKEDSRKADQLRDQESKY